MSEKENENLLNPDKSLTLDMARCFMLKYSDYYERKRGLKPEGKLIAPTRQKIAPIQVLTSARD